MNSSSSGINGSNVGANGLSVVPGAASQTPSQMKAMIKAELAGHNPIHIVYIDDDEILLETYRMRLANLGFHVFTTTLAAEACEYIAKNRDQIAVIISDYQMPGLTGFQFREQIIEQAPSIPFVILSGYIDKEMALHGLALKISGFVEKVNSDVLLQLIVRDGIARIRSIVEERELLKGFIAESEDVIERAEALILNLDQNPHDLESLNHFFGLVHTLKGASSFFEPKSMHLFAHRFEEVLKKLQRGEMAVDATIVSQLFASIDQIKILLADFKSGFVREFDPEQAFAKIFVATVAVSKPADAIADGEHDKTKGPAPTNQPAEIKVPVMMLDEFMHISGEMTVIRNMLNKCVRSIEKQYSGDKEIGILVELLEELHKVNGGVQSKISEMRKVSVRSVLKPIPRAVREVARALGKDVELKVDGDELRIDTAIADVLSNSLLHIVKNSIDHGLENPKQRAEAGKPKSGTIAISSRLQNEQVIVEIKDDGRGLNAKAIREKLVRNGTHSAAEAETLPLDRLYSMIFEPGFSTAQQVTDISGRGVGMSLVKSVVESVRGKIQIRSDAGVGSTFTLTLPVPRSVLITNCLFVKAAGDQFGILEEDVLRVLRIDSENDERVRHFEGGSALHLENELIPIVHLDALLVDESDVAQVANSDTSGIFSLVLLQSTAHGRKIALQVDEILDVEDTVIKGLPFQINPHGIYQGATFLDDGRIGLILGTSGIVERIGLKIQPPALAQLSTTFDVSSVPTEKLLLLEVEGYGLCGLSSSEVHRIEELDARLFVGPSTATDRMTHVERIDQGQQFRQIPYRGRVLSIVRLSQFLPLPTNVGMQNRPTALASESNDLATTPVVVIERGQSLFGIRALHVLEIIDLKIINASLLDKGIRCQGFHEDRLVTVLDLDVFLHLPSSGSRAA